MLRLLKHYGTKIQNTFEKDTSEDIYACSYMENILSSTYDLRATEIMLSHEMNFLLPHHHLYTRRRENDDPQMTVSELKDELISSITELKMLSEKIQNREGYSTHDESLMPREINDVPSAIKALEVIIQTRLLTCVNEKEFKNKRITELCNNTMKYIQEFKTYKNWM